MYRLMGLPDGVEGIRETMRKMRTIQKNYRTSPFVRKLAIDICKNLKQKDYNGEIRAIHAYCRDCIRYIRDVAGVETLQSPVETVKRRAGDCDDKSILCACLLGAAGHKTAFFAVGAAPGIYSHVLPAVWVEGVGRWLPLECTDQVKPGWFPPGAKSLMIIRNDK